MLKVAFNTNQSIILFLWCFLLQNAVIPEGYFFSDIPESVQSILSKSSKKSDQTLVSSHISYILENVKAVGVSHQYSWIKILGVR